MKNSLGAQKLSDDSLYLVKDWVMLGPFYLDNNETIKHRMEKDLFKIHGREENSFSDYNEFIKFAINISEKDNSKILTKFEASYDIVDLSNFISLKPLSAAFVATNIDVSEDCMLGINISAYQSASVYLNGKKVYDIAWKKGRNFFREDFFVTEFRKGNNFLMVKIAVSDPEYKPGKWMFELNLSTVNMSKRLFKDSYNKSFLRRSLISDHENLRLYCGPYAKETINYKIISTIDKTEILKGSGTADRKTGELVIPAGNIYKKTGLYKSLIYLDNKIYDQDFFVGNIDVFVDSLYKVYKGLKFDNIEKTLDFEGLFHRLYISSRRGATVPDDQFEHWNRNRIPSLKNLLRAIEDAKNGIHNSNTFFLRYYYSNFYKGLHSYSAYFPESGTNEKLPLFIYIIDSEKPVRNWHGHYFNYMSRWINDAQNLSNKYKFVTLWTDCGGKIETLDQVNIFKGILRDAEKKYPIDKNKIFVIGNCATTDLALTMLKFFPKKIAGGGFINPNSLVSPYFSTRNQYNHKLSMIFAPYDEIIPDSVTFDFYRNIKTQDPSAKIFSYKYATHYNAPGDYAELLYVDLLNR